MKINTNYTNSILQNDFKKSKKNNQKSNSQVSFEGIGPGSVKKALHASMILLAMGLSSCHQTKPPKDSTLTQLEFMMASDDPYIRKLAAKEYATMAGKSVKDTTDNNFKTDAFIK